jgi:hypothetical protein
MLREAESYVKQCRGSLNMQRLWNLIQAYLAMCESKPSNDPALHRS